LDPNSTLMPGCSWQLFHLQSSQGQGRGAKQSHLWQASFFLPVCQFLACSTQCGDKYSPRNAARRLKFAGRTSAGIAIAVLRLVIKPESNFYPVENSKKRTQKLKEENPAENKIQSSFPLQAHQVSLQGGGQSGGGGAPPRRQRRSRR